MECMEDIACVFFCIKCSAEGESACGNNNWSCARIGYAICCFLFAEKTVWIDSIANVNHLSLCGRVAKKFASRFYTQWKELEDKDVFFAGNVIG